MSKAERAVADEPPTRSARPIRRELTPLFEELRGERVIVRPHNVADFDEMWEAIQESKRATASLAALRRPVARRPARLADARRSALADARDAGLRDRGPRDGPYRR